MTNSEFQEIGMYLQIAQAAHGFGAEDLKRMAVDCAKYKLEKSGPVGTMLTVEPKIVKFEK